MRLKTVAVIAAGAAVTAGAVHPHAAVKAAGAPRPEVVAFAEQQAGKPYLWGGTGPDAYDCSGLAMMAYRAAGMSIPRTSQEQWAAGPQVRSPRPGDLVFFAGADGTAASPGHVGIVTGPHAMVDAYAAGTGVRHDTFGLASSAPGLSDPVGYTRPAASS